MITEFYVEEVENMYPENNKPAEYKTLDEIFRAFEKGIISSNEALSLFFNLNCEAVSKECGEIPEIHAMEDALKELDQLIGLSSVKKLVKEIRAFIEIQKRREKEALLNEPLVLHMIFKGNPGTGKTTVARIMGNIFKEMSILEKGHLIEVERADLVGEYIGHTAQKTREQIKRALGGILFIDEAYSLARGGQKDFGKEAIDTLVKAMEDHKNEFILILAGYTQEMEMFLQMNPGLRSRFPIHIEFPDYTIGELLSIAELMLSQRQYKLSGLAREKLITMLEKNEENPGNARTVRNIIEKGIRKQAVRLVDKPKITREELMTIKPDDLEEAT
jgi:stage V sporulation protein K